jgi:hypothetical protein
MQALEKKNTISQMNNFFIKENALATWIHIRLCDFNF